MKVSLLAKPGPVPFLPQAWQRSVLQGSMLSTESSEETSDSHKSVRHQDHAVAAAAEEVGLLPCLQSAIAATGVLQTSLIQTFTLSS